MNRVPEIPSGTWVTIEQVVLPPGERAPGLPLETAEAPLVARVKGFLLAPAALGQEAWVRTAIGREAHGMLRVANPAYQHGFGELVAELLSIGEEARARLREE